jgi:hypothetical protein
LYLHRIAKHITNVLERQRQRAKQGKLLDEKRKKLEAVDFEFQCVAKYEKKTSFTAEQVKQWEKSHRHFWEFHKANGHRMVPYHYEANPTLEHCESKQRAYFSRGILNPERNTVWTS